MITQAHAPTFIAISLLIASISEPARATRPIDPSRSPTYYARLLIERKIALDTQTLLQTASDSSRPELWFAALDILGESADPSAVEPLLRLLSKEAEDSRIWPIAWSLARLGSPRGRAALVRIVKESQDFDLRLTIAERLIRIEPSSEPARQEVLSALQSPSSQLKVRAISAVASARRPLDPAFSREIERRLLLLADDVDTRVRAIFDSSAGFYFRSWDGITDRSRCLDLAKYGSDPLRSAGARIVRQQLNCSLYEGIFSPKDLDVDGSLSKARTESARGCGAFSEAEQFAVAARIHHLTYVVAEGQPQESRIAEALAREYGCLLAAPRKWAPGERQLAEEGRVQHTREWARREPVNPEAWYLLALASTQQAERVSSLLKVLRLRPFHFEARFLLGQLLAAQGDIERAILEIRLSFEEASGERRREIGEALAARLTAMGKIDEAKRISAELTQPHQR